MDGEDARIAGCAAGLFHAHGITATGVDALARAAGVSKRTLYQRFGSKDGLIAAAYEALDLPVFEMFTRPAEAAGPSGEAQLDGFFARLEELVRLPEFRGCPFSNAAAELADPGHPAHAVVRRHKARIAGWIRERAVMTGARDPDGLARALMLVFAGAQVQAVVEGSPQPARDARTLARRLVHEAAPPP